jgi:deazaflavin-dependent oxidoreductase (nitroreductase family)
MFGTLNAVVEPLVRAGVVLPLLCPQSLIVLESRGRTTGQLRRTPLLAAVIGDLAVIGTVRPRRSQWIRNAAASPNVRYFRFGRVREAQAFVFIPSEREIVLGTMSPLAQLVAAGRRAYPYSMPPLSVIPRRASIWRCKF